MTVCNKTTRKLIDISFQTVSKESDRPVVSLLPVFMVSWANQPLAPATYFFLKGIDFKMSNYSFKLFSVLIWDL